MVFSDYTKQRMIFYHQQGLKPPKISSLLEEEGIQASRRGVLKFIKRYAITGTITRKPGSGGSSKIPPAIKQLIEAKMRADDESTAMQLHQMLTTHGYKISKRTILRCRIELGWTFRGSAYCQLIREANKQKRLLWARQYQDDGFENVLWTDECSVQLETHRRFCCRKRGEPPRNKPRYSKRH